MSDRFIEAIPTSELLRYLMGWQDDEGCVAERTREGIKARLDELDKRIPIRERQPVVVVCKGAVMFQKPVESDDKELIEFLSSERAMHYGEIENRFPGFMMACLRAGKDLKNRTGKETDKFVHKDDQVQAVLVGTIHTEESHWVEIDPKDHFPGG